MYISFTIPLPWRFILKEMITTKKCVCSCLPSANTLILILKNHFYSSPFTNRGKLRIKPHSYIILAIHVPLWLVFTHHGTGVGGRGGLKSAPKQHIATPARSHARCTLFLLYCTHITSSPQVCGNRSSWAPKKMNNLSKTTETPCSHCSDLICQLGM